MKFTVTQDAFSRGLTVVNRSVSQRSTLPVIMNILISSDNGRIKLSGTNLEISLSCWIDAKIEEEGAITLPARTLVDIANSFSPGDVTFSVSNSTLTATISNYTTVLELKGINADEFPFIPTANLREGVDLNLNNFKSLIQQVAFSASTEESRPALQSIKVDVSGRKIMLTSTDGYRLSIREEVLDNPVEKDFTVLVPIRAMNELAKITSGGGELSMSVPDGKGIVIFHTRDVDLVSQLIGGSYPDVKIIIPSYFKTHTIIPTNLFLSACKQAQVIAREGNNVAKLSIIPGESDEGLVEIKAQTDSTGNSDVQIVARVEGNPLAISFDVRYLREVLEVIKTENVILDTIAGNAAATIRPEGDEGYLHLMMPRVN